MLRNNKAFSLIELMITSALGVIVTLGIATVFVFAMEQFTIMVEKNTAEENSMIMMYHLRNYLTQAVDLYAVNDVASVYTPPGCVGAECLGAGQLDVDFELINSASWPGAGGGDNGAFARFAAFNREAGRLTGGGASGTMPTGGSVMQTTGIFVKDTDAAGLDPDARSGALVFDHNSNGAPMIPSANDLYFTRLHNFRVQRTGGNLSVEVMRSDGVLFNTLPLAWVPAGGMRYKIKTITLEIITRYFKNTPKSDWDYRTTGATSVAPYRDIVQTVKVNFKDNVLTTNSLTGGSGEERVHGSLYFFDFILPATRAN